MMASVLLASTVWPSGSGASGSGPQAGVCSPSPSSSWEWGWAVSKMDEEQGWMPAVVYTVPAGGGFCQSS